MTADVPAMEGAKASAAMILILFSTNILASEPERLKLVASFAWGKEDVSKTSCLNQFMFPHEKYESLLNGLFVTVKLVKPFSWVGLCQ